MWLRRRFGFVCFLAFCFFGVVGCVLWGSEQVTLQERPLCEALNLLSTKDFLQNHNEGVFDQSKNFGKGMLRVPASVRKHYDGKNLLMLRSAEVDFDYEDGSVDFGNIGGFYARWKIVMVPFEKKLFKALQKAHNNFDRSKILYRVSHKKNRIEAILPGPFRRNGCEWGDTRQIGSQKLEYKNYGIYDWDYFPKVDRVLGIVYEGDEGIHDDFITWFDASKKQETIVLAKEGAFRIVIDSLSSGNPESKDEKIETRISATHR